MSKLTPLLILLACATLTACQTVKPPSPTPLRAQTQTLKPTVDCGQDEPDATLPAYPVRGGDLAIYSAAQEEWAIGAAGAFRGEKVLRHNTSKCLGDLRAKGLIN